MPRRERIVEAGLQFKGRQPGINRSRVALHARDFGNCRPSGPAEDAQGIGESDDRRGDREVDGLAGPVFEIVSTRLSPGIPLFSHEVFASSDELASRAVDEAHLNESADRSAGFSEEPAGRDASDGEGFQDRSEALAVGEADQMEHG